MSDQSNPARLEKNARRDSPAREVETQIRELIQDWEDDELEMLEIFGEEDWGHDPFRGYHREPVLR